MEARLLLELMVRWSFSPCSCFFPHVALRAPGGGPGVAEDHDLDDVHGRGRRLEDIRGDGRGHREGQEPAHGYA